MIRIGCIRELVRYPVKSMAGVPIHSAFLGWHGLEGDRRYAFRRLGDRSGFPWLSASRMPELLLYQPCGNQESAVEPLPTHVRTPEGQEKDLEGDALTRKISEQLKSPVELLRLKHGIFDEAVISLVSFATISAITSECSLNPDSRRFRANILVETDQIQPFLEDQWIGATLLFGDSDPTPAVKITLRDLRCSMLNLDPTTAAPDPRVIKTVVRLNDNYAGVYGTVLQTGLLRVGDFIRLLPA